MKWSKFEEIKNFLHQQLTTLFLDICHLKNRLADGQSTVSRLMSGMTGLSLSRHTFMPNLNKMHVTAFTKYQGEIRKVEKGFLQNNFFFFANFLPIRLLTVVK